MPIRWHEEDPVLLREAIRFTAAETGFSERLIEKDYFCSVVLEYLAAHDQTLVFKGGTCLAKIHAGFYRLSEDLDFSIPVPLESSRAERRRRSDNFKKVIAALPAELQVFRIVEPLKGANSSTQYTVTVGYESLLDSHLESIAVEVGLREPKLAEVLTGQSNTVLVNPFDGQALVPSYPVRCLSYFEAMAEKIRAALCRREVAIRDFFDVDYAVRHASFDTSNPELLELLRRKIAVPGTLEVDATPERMARLQRQVDAQLRPVLRAQEFTMFNLERSIDTVVQIGRDAGMTSSGD